VAVLLALCSAIAYGMSDFLGGVLSRRSSAWPVAVVGQVSATVCTAFVAMFFAGEPRSVDFGWAALAGIGSGCGAGFLYRGFASGRMAVVGPISAVGAALVPVLAGVAGGGERPSALVWLGTVVALPGIWLVARPSSNGGSTGLADGWLDGLLAGVGFGVLFAALGQVPDTAGLWPLTLAQAVSLPAVIVLATAVRASWLPRSRTSWAAAVMGPLGTCATAAFLLASQRGYLAVAGVLTSLYPASTVLLAAVFLHERVHRAQGVGLGLCAVAISLVAAG
jgi:drug/metabolite transporter (DMT)-like permease